MSDDEPQRYVSVDAESACVLVSSKAGALIDVRTPEEFVESHAPAAINIPFMLQTNEGRKHNPEFLTQVRQQFPDSSSPQLVVTCAGGSRGTSAADAIAKAGYAAVLCMPGGMKAWTARGLPVE